LKNTLNKYIVFIFLTLLISNLQLTAQDISDSAESKKVVATGTGSIFDNNIAKARDDAIEDALRRALEQTLGTMIEAETFVENYQVIDDNIFSETKGYIQNYQVVREQKRNDYLYEVMVTAVVSMENLQNDLEAIATLMRRKNMPRMMVMIDEKNIGKSVGLLNYIEAETNNAETAIIDEMMEKGFTFIDQSTVKQNLTREKAAAILQGNTEMAAALGKKIGAEVVLTGKALANATEVEVYGTKQRSQQATVNVKAIRTDTGEIIAIASADGAYPHINDMVGGAKAINKACVKLSDELVEKILSRWQKDVSSGTIVTLRVQGLDDYSQLSKFKSSLQYYVRGINSVVQRQWSAGYADLDVNFKGTGEDLAQRLSGKSFEGMTVKVVGLSQNQVSVEVSVD
jgi:hypothetical protein